MTIAKTRPKFRICSGLITLTILSIPQLIKAQTTFTYVDTNGYVLAGFRNGGTQEFVANLGKIEAFQELGPGVTTNLGSYSPAQLSEAFSDYNNLNWSVFSTFNNSTFSPLGSMPFGTAWWTVPRTDLNTQTTPPARFSLATMSGIRNQILSIGNDAVVSCSHPGASSADFGASFVVELSSDPYNLEYSIFMADANFPSKGTFHGRLSYSVENVTPAGFTTAVRSDFYRLVPNTVVDPDTGNKTASYYVGYFQLDPDGTMSFTRAGGTAALIPAPVLTIVRSGNVSTISFLSTNAATYSLYFTNTSGLTTSVTNWPSLPGTLNGNNSTLSFTDATPDPNRIYRVIAQ